MPDRFLRSYVAAVLAGPERLRTGLRVASAALRRSTAILESHNDIHGLIAEDRPLEQILEAIVVSMERHDPDLHGSILLADLQAGTMHHGAASRLPAAYQEAIDGLRFGPVAGSCGAAIATGREAITPDIATDPRWEGWRHLVDPLGLRHCWSFPLLDRDGTVLGSLGAYGTQRRSPGTADLDFLRDLARLAEIAIERRRSHDALVRAATHDSLTGLVNRAAAFAALDALLRRQPPQPVAVLFIDLDRLKVINDSLGHDRGDWVMVQTAGRLEACVGPGDVVARLGGDELLIVSPGDERHATELSERVLATLRAPLVELVTGEPMPVTASVGIAVVSGPDIDASRAVHRADTAMYAVKARGGNGCAWSDHDGTAAPGRRAVLEGALRHAIARGELSVVYQPIVRFADDVVQGVEALARWHHPQLGDVAPDEFIPVAEQIGLIGDIGAWVLDRACAAYATMRARHGDHLYLSVNLSPPQLHEPHLPELVAGTAARHGVPVGRLILEITETALLGSDPAADACLNALHAIGARLSLDDFGTGYSSLALLKRYPIRAIKIDRSFVAGLPQDAGDRAIVAAVIGMGHGLGLAIVAEGIETHDQHEVLRELGCDFAQGFLFGRPAPLEPRGSDSRRLGGVDDQVAEDARRGAAGVERLPGDHGGG